MTAQRRARAGDPRRVAHDVLEAVRVRDAYANLELSKLLRERRLDARDAGLATELTSGTLRMQGAYDAILDSLVSRPIDAPLRDVLRLGAHQLLAMRVPTHAAVDTCVELARATVGHRVAGFANAVLRKVAAHDFETWMDRLEAPASVRYSHPQWVVELLAEALGEDPEALLAADNQPPEVTLVARPGLAEVAELVAAGAQARPVSPYAAVWPGGDPGALAAVREGRAGVQDAGSQLVAHALAAAAVTPVDPVASGEAAISERWLDLCAGPGGKAALLAALAAQRGARLLAAERQPHRARLVRRAGVGDVIAADGTRPAWRPAFDRVLADVPCTGLGALRRRPEARWRRTPEDLGSLVPLQRALLASALDSTRAGGVVGYATCSPVLAETVEVVREVVADRDVEILDAPALLPWVADCESRHLQGALQLWPHRHGTDAMFLALLRVNARDRPAIH